MASGALPSLPVLTFRKNLTVNDMTKDPSKDEKTSIKAVPTEEPYSGNDEKINLSYVDSDTFVGDVYEDLRVIDLGDDGKERPIGNYSMPFFVRLADHLIVTSNCKRLEPSADFSGSKLISLRRIWT